MWFIAGHPAQAAAEFKLIEDNPNVYTVDTGAGLVFAVRRDDPPGSLRAPGDICSLQWNGVELQAPDRGSHVASGFPPAKIAAQKIGNEIIQITVESPQITHYYVARRGLPHIYMASYVTDQWSLGETRWITRMNDRLFTQRPPHSDLTGTDRTIESRDVSATPDGRTRSKYYGNMRAKDLAIRGVTGPGVGVFMAYGNRETSSGGPFFRDIQNQNSEVYNYMNSGHCQTEPFRHGLHGFYALVFTDGAIARQPDFSFMETLALKGLVPAGARGAVSGGVVRGRDSRYRYTVALSNPQAQYWADAGAKDGGFLISKVKPGTYQLQIYKNELSVYSAEVAVTAGKTTRLDPIAITGDPSLTPAVWRIGDWDGTPLEMLNGDKITVMHPSDIRMAKWRPGAYIIGQSIPSKAMPCCQWRDVNADQSVVFRLSNNQVVAGKLRIGITVAFGGGRPVVSVNDKWSSRPPGPSAQPRSRSMTIGTYRGNHTTYTYDIPASALQSGNNTLKFSPISGSGGGGFLSPGYSIDCIDFIH